MSCSRDQSIMFIRRSPMCLIVASLSFSFIFLSLPPRPFVCSHAFTYVNRVVEGHGASFNWRLCNYEMPDRNPSACHHKVHRRGSVLFV